MGGARLTRTGEAGPAAHDLGVATSDDAARLAGVTLQEAEEAHGRALAPFFPEEAAGLDTTSWARGLMDAGLPTAPEHFMRASGAALLGGPPSGDVVLEADMMVAHVAAMVGICELRVHCR